MLAVFLTRSGGVSLRNAGLSENPAHIFGVGLPQMYLVSLAEGFGMVVTSMCRPAQRWWYTLVWFVLSGYTDAAEPAARFAFEKPRLPCRL